MCLVIGVEISCVLYDGEISCVLGDGQVQRLAVCCVTERWRD